MNCLSVFELFVGFTLKALTVLWPSALVWEDVDRQLAEFAIIQVKRASFKVNNFHKIRIAVFVWKTWYTRRVIYESKWL